MDHRSVPQKNWAPHGDWRSSWNCQNLLDRLYASQSCEKQAKIKIDRTATSTGANGNFSIIHRVFVFPFRNVSNGRVTMSLEWTILTETTDLDAELLNEEPVTAACRAALPLIETLSWLSGHVGKPLVDEVRVKRVRGYARRLTTDVERLEQFLTDVVCDKLRSANPHPISYGSTSAASNTELMLGLGYAFFRNALVVTNPRQATQLKRGQDLSKTLDVDLLLDKWEEMRDVAAVNYRQLQTDIKTEWREALGNVQTKPPPQIQTAIQQDVWEALYKTSLTLDQLQAVTNHSRAALLDQMKPLREPGLIDNNIGLGGYFRPDAPPDW